MSPKALALCATLVALAGPASARDANMDPDGYARL